MIRKINQILFLIAVVGMLASCKNTKQKLQEHVTAYNSAASSFKGEHITNTTARGYINDSKIELRIETDLPQNEANKLNAIKTFPDLLTEMIKKNEISKELIEENVQFDVYFLANDNTVLAKQIINNEQIDRFLKK
jgi:cobalamin biosynthesis protein CobT